MEYKLFLGDCMDVLRQLPAQSVNLVLTDPPYNIGVATEKNRKKEINRWDKIDGYNDWCIEWMTECQRVLKPNGVLYFWHNDMKQIAELLQTIRQKTSLAFVSFCIWDKGFGYRANTWHNRDTNGEAPLRSWFNICEYCLHFFNAPRDAEASWKHTGLDRINSNKECYRPLKDWYAAEKARIGLTDEDIAEKYTEVTGKKPYMMNHYFCDSQFSIPTRAVWESVYEPLGFGKSYEELRQSYEKLRQSYEELRQSYEELRNYHRCDPMHCNIWHVPPVPSNGRLHTCQKPLEILKRLINVSCPPDGTVLDCFMGSGSTGVACVNMGRNFIGIEKETKYFESAKKWIESEAAQTRLF